MYQNKPILNQILINPIQIIRVLGIIALFIVMASVGGQLIKYLTGHESVYGLIPLFFLGYECNVPTYFISFLGLFSALLLLGIKILEQNRKSPHSSKWVILSIGFFYISIDEIISLHEKLIKPISGLLGDGHLGIFTFAWVLVGIPVVIILAIFFFRFLMQLNQNTKISFLIAATLYIGGSIGLELIGGRYFELHGSNNLTYCMMQNMEETLEMVGLIVFIWGLLSYLANIFKTIILQFADVRMQSPSDSQV
jgi:hypothetical protein